MKGRDQRYKTALKLMQRGGDVAKAHALLAAAADDGDAFSIYALGTWRLHGFFLKKNLREAARLLRLAADADVAYACFDLAICYEQGEGVKKNLSHAAKYYLRAFLLGDEESAASVERIFCWYGSELNLRAISKEFVRATRLS
ncbi:tetratricopeptide repeat protein [Dyella marensis]|uniref:Sel1 repeat-containing protein n=1 Tax=Dyella marensis TaxID=500610 RepID=A0A1I2H933_9GAMM|nr:MULTISPECIES: tetratricopeptide repeat protein [Dyella]SFF25883.1 Sel1 repeat-containing protein [Dyella marensis]